ncbi:hypothetical protein J2Y55_000717 [Bosea sp. BE125]|uniref:DUF3616 domain-containing protein n=1 Tax=Bosea sp. BE125 TaxID=2817909 RepID=UPI002857E36F|nr:DUF3616 domain-containing protein [Bosea sp. BE125]MDR6869724.1 hypothetical protein [Bosea sp. BE125]
MRHLRLCTLLASALLATSPALADTLQPLRRIEVTSDFAGKKPGKPAHDVSGMACMPARDGKQRCLLINDENTAAQFATLRDGALTPGESVPLLGDAPSPATLGAPPAVACPEQGKFRDLDGESVAFSASHFYVAGSHGCSRHSGQFRLSAFHLARIKVDANGRAEGAPELTYRLSDLLRRAGSAGGFFGRDLMSANGMNVEAIAVAGDRLWAGLRAPSLDGKAFLVGASLADLFATGHEPARGEPRLVAVPLGGQRGFRDLAALKDGRLLALAGPAQEQDLDYAVMLIDPARPGAVRELGRLRNRDSAKAEALVVTGEDAAGLTVLIGYDGPKNGKFEEYRLPLP